MHQDGKYSMLVRWVAVRTRVKAEVGVSGFMAYLMSNHQVSYKHLCIEMKTAEFFK